ncbi:uncharacterized protein LOC126560044 [Anopheles maculipalpis]|uniref:uncharacterized protein LOC126560044 n=1 Tax=Anopheles maculipalpis TaxID=1496333 RepID=UPI0021591097|nr:uncharacterized protein LOC126560044 [Anopheles maculipalpis]
MFQRRQVSLYLVVLAFVWRIATATGNGNWWNKTQSYELYINRVVCADTPYLETELLKCRSVSRRNLMPSIYVTIYVPKVYNYMMVQYTMYYKFQTYQPFLINGEFEVCDTLKDNYPGTLRDPLTTYALRILKQMIPKLVVPCPHGNQTYVVETVFEKEYAPQSIPAGDYRLDLRFAAKSNVTLLHLQGYFSARRKGILSSMIEW